MGSDMKAVNLQCKKCDNVVIYAEPIMKKYCLKLIDNYSCILYPSYTIFLWDCGKYCKYYCVYIIE